MHMRALAVVAATGLLITACGDDSNDEPQSGPTTPRTTAAPPPETSTASAETAGTDQQQIDALVQRSFTSEEKDVACKTFSVRLQREIYGSPAACLKVDDDEDEDDPDEMRLAATRVSGDTATTRVTAVGGATDGAGGGLGLARENGVWRIDRLEIDLVRDLVVRGVQSPQFAAQEAFGSESVRRCFAGALRDLPDDELRTFAYDSISERNDQRAERAIAPALLRCQLRSQDGRRQIRRQFEAPIRRGIGGLEIPESAKRCIIRRIRDTVSLEQVVDLSIEQIRTGRQSPRSRELGENAARYCLARRTD